MSHRTVFHAAELERAVHLVQTYGSLLVRAANGIGRTHFLSQLRTKLAVPDAPILHAGDRNAAAAITSHGRQPLIGVDGFEYASAPTVEAVLERVDAGGQCVAVLDPSNRNSLFHRSLAALDPTATGAVMPIDEFAILQLPALGEHDIARLVHEHSSAPLTADLVDAIVTLAEGRPRWALALLELAEAGSIVTFPRPTIVNAPPTGRAAATLRDVASGVGALPQSALAAALVLSELEPLDMPGVHDLIGHDLAVVLRDAGALLPVGDPPLWHVPPFLAAALSDHAPYGELAAFEAEVQVRLLQRQAHGIPLSLSEALLCSRALPRMPDGPDADWFALQRSTVIQHSISELVGFGHTELARSLFLRTNQHQSALSPVLRAATLGALVSPEVGLSQLAAPPPPEQTDDYLAWAGLRSILTPTGDPGVPSPEETDTTDRTDAGVDSALLVGLWQHCEPIDAYATRLLDVVQRNPFNGLGLFAGALIDLESAWHGNAVEGRWLHAGLPMPRTREHTASALPHVSGTILLTQALTCFVLGEGLSRYDEIRALADRSPLREHHVRWLRHYHEASLALGCGDLARAKREWELLLTCAPSLAPWRLKQRLSGALQALAWAADPAGGGSRPPGATAADPSTVRDLFRYFGGQHAALTKTGMRVSSHPVHELARAHLVAAASNNPRELVRVADALWERDAWAPALAALTQARDVFLSRRATTSATECAERIARAVSSMAQHVPWFSPPTAPGTDFQRLTEREVETATLAARGLSNREIAIEMNCSVRTVESHLAQARAKLGVSNRRELASFAQLQPDPNAAREPGIRSGASRTTTTLR